MSAEDKVTLPATVNVIPELEENVPPPVPMLMGVLPVEKLAVAAKVLSPSMVKALGAPKPRVPPTDNIEELVTVTAPVRALLFPFSATVPPPETVKVFAEDIVILPVTVIVVPELGENVPPPVPMVMGALPVDKLAVDTKIPPPCSVNVLGDPKLAALPMDNMEASVIVNPPFKEVLVPLKTTVPSPEIVNVFPEELLTLPATVNVMPEPGANTPPPVPTVMGRVRVEKLVVGTKIPPPCSVKELGEPIRARLSIDSIAG